LGEDTIAQDSYYSFAYAQDVLKDRFKKGEGVIIKEKVWLRKYMNLLKKFNKLEEFLRDFPEVKKYTKK